MKIHEYRIGDYKAFLDGRTEWPWRGTVQPVSRQRVACQSRNPRADDDDVALLVGVDEDGAVISYLGILPDSLHLENTVEKFGWLTTWWVKPGTEGPGPLFLLMRALKCYSGRIGVSEYSDSAARIYEAMGSKFSVISPRVATYYHLKPDLVTILTRRYGTGLPVRIAAAVARSLTDIVMNTRAYLWNRRNSRPHQQPKLEYLGQLDSRSQSYLEKYDRSDEIFRRDINDLNWLMRDRWALVTPLNDVESGKYAFSVHSQRFEIFGLHLLRETGEIAGLMILTFRDGMLKIPYSFLDDDMYDAAALAIWLHAYRLSARTTLVVDNQLTAALEKLNYPTLLTKRMPRNSLSSVGKQIDNKVYLHDGDGDCAFT